MPGERPTRQEHWTRRSATKDPARTYKTNTGAKGSADGEVVQAVDDGLKPLDQFTVTVSEFIKSLGLFLEYGKDCLGRIACIDLWGEWVLAKILPRLIGIFSQGGIEADFEVEGRGGCTSGG